MINYEFPPFGGGTGMACSQLLDQFAARRDIMVDLVTSGPVAAPTREVIGDGVVVHRLPVAKEDLHFWKARELAGWTRRALTYADDLVRRQPFQVCHCWAGWPSGIVGWRLRRHLPYVVALRGSDVPGYSARLRRLDPLLMSHVSRRVWRRASRVVAVSRTLRDLALKTTPGMPIDVIPNGVDVDQFTPGPVGEGGLLFVGRLIERKGVHRLIEATARLAADHPDLMLTVVGDGPERGRLEQLARDLDVGGRVRFLGHLGRDALADVYREASIFVLPADSDAMPNVVLEAMSAGLAIVTTRCGAAELLRGNGCVVDRLDAEALSSALAPYLADRNLLVRSQRASRRLAEGMAWDNVAEYFMAVFDDVIAAPAAAVAAPPREFRLLST